MLKYNYRHQATRPGISVILLLLILCLTGSVQTASENRTESLYGGIEIGAKRVRAAVISVKDAEEGYSVKLVFAEAINSTIMQLDNNKFAPDAVRDTALAAQKLLTRMKTEYKVPAEQISIIGSSGVRAENSGDLVYAIREMTGKTMSFLDVETEVQLSIVGTIPQRYKTENGWAENRGTSVLIDIGSGNTKGGYQVIRQTMTGTPDYDYVTVGIPKGTVTFTNEINDIIGDEGDQMDFVRKARELSPASIRAELRKEMERKPGLINRQRVYLAGGIVWAMVTLMRPDDRRTLTPITADEIEMFYRAVTKNPDSLQKLLYPDLSRRIPNRQLRAEVEMDIETVRNTYSPRNLIAGAEILRAVSKEFGLQNKKIRFARYSHLSWIVSYVRLQSSASNP